MCCVYFLYPSVDAPGLLPYLDLGKNAAVDVGVQMSPQQIAFSSFGYLPRSGTAGSYSNSVFSFCGISLCFA